METLMTGDGAGDLEALITAAYEAREAAKAQERAEKDRRRQELEERQVRAFLDTLNEALPLEIQAALCVHVEYDPRASKDVYGVRAYFNHYDEGFCLRYHGGGSWTVSHLTAMVDESHFPGGLNVDSCSLTPQLLAYLGDVRRYVAALTANEDAAQSADQARHDKENR